MCWGRILFMGLCSMPAIKQWYIYVTDPRCKRLGNHCWVNLSTSFSTNNYIDNPFSAVHHDRPRGNSRPNQIRLRRVFAREHQLHSSMGRHHVHRRLCRTYVERLLRCLLPPKRLSSKRRRDRARRQCQQTEKI